MCLLKAWISVCYVARVAICYYNTKMFASNYTHTQPGKGRSRAFTLVEIIIVTVIVGLLAGLAIFKLADTQQRADLNFLRSSIAAIENGITRVVLVENTFPTITGITPEEKLVNILNVLATKQVYVFTPQEQVRFLNLADQVLSSQSSILSTNSKIREGKPSGDPTAFEILVLPATESVVYPTPIVLLLNDPSNPNTAYADAGLNNPGGSNPLQQSVNEALSYYRTNGAFRNNADRLLVLSNLALSNLTKAELDTLMATVSPEELLSISSQLLALLKSNDLGNLNLTRTEAGAVFSNTLERGAASDAAIAALDLSGAFPWDVLTSRGLNNVISLRTNDITEDMIPTLLASLALNPNLLSQNPFYNVPDFNADTENAFSVLTGKFGSKPSFWEALVSSDFPIPASGSLLDSYFDQENMPRDLTVALMDHYISGLLNVPTGTADFASAISSKLQHYFQAVNIDSDPPEPLSASQSKNVFDLIARHPSIYSPSILNDASNLFDYSLLTGADLNSIYEAILDTGVTTEELYNYPDFFTEAAKTAALPPAFVDDIYTRSLDSVSNIPTTLIGALFSNNNLTPTELQNLYDVALASVVDSGNPYQYYSIQGMLEGILGTGTFSDTDKLALLNAIPSDTYETYEYLTKLQFADPQNFNSIITDLKAAATSSHVFPANSNDYTDDDWDASDAAYAQFEYLDALMYNKNIPIADKQALLTDLIASNGWGDANLYSLIGANSSVLSLDNINSLVDFLETNPIADFPQDQVVGGYANVISSLYDSNSPLTSQEKLAIISRLNTANIIIPPADTGSSDLTVSNMIAGLDPADKASALELLWEYSSKVYTAAPTDATEYYVEALEPARLISILSEMTPQRAQEALNTTFPLSEHINAIDTYGTLIQSHLTSDKPLPPQVAALLYERAFTALNEEYSTSGDYSPSLGGVSLNTLIQDPAAQTSPGFKTLLNNVLTTSPDNINAYRTAAEYPNILSSATLAAVLNSALNSSDYVDTAAINKLYSSPQLAAPENAALLASVVAKVRADSDAEAAANLFTNAAAVSAYATAVVDQYNLDDQYSSTSLYNNNNMPNVSNSDLGKLASTNQYIANSLFKTTTVSISSLLTAADQGKWDLSSPFIKSAFQSNVSSLITAARNTGQGASLAQTFAPYLSNEQIAQLLAP